MKKQKLKLIACVLVLCTILTSNFSAFAYIKENKNIYLKYEDVASYINLTDKVKTNNILDKPVKYYYGDDFIVVEELEGYSLITEDENGSLYVNGSYVEITHNISRTSNLSVNNTTSDDWQYFDTDNVSFSIGGLTLAVATALIELKLTNTPDSTLQAIGVAISAYIAGQFFPDIFVFTYERVEYVRVEDPFIGTMSWKYVHDIYLGPDNDERQYNPYGWTTYNYNTV